jgi:hypothetical protein
MRDARADFSAHCVALIQRGSGASGQHLVKGDKHGLTASRWRSVFLGAASIALARLWICQDGRRFRVNVGSGPTAIAGTSAVTSQLAGDRPLA